MCVCMCACVYVSMHTRAYVNVCACVRACVCVCVLYVGSHGGKADGGSKRGWVEESGRLPSVSCTV